MDILCLHSYCHLILANNTVNYVILSLLSLFLSFLLLNVVNKSFKKDNILYTLTFILYLYMCTYMCICTYKIFIKICLKFFHILY